MSCSYSNTNSSNNWKLVKSYCVGSSHLNSDLPCQDYVDFELFDGGFCAALADGAGSARYSNLGAQCVVETTLSFLSTNISNIQRKCEKDIADLVLATNLEQLGNLAINLDCNIEDLASTLLAVVVLNNKYIVIHLGDGVIGRQVVFNNGFDITNTYSEPDNGEFSNETYFVTSAASRNRIRVYKGLVESKNLKITGFIMMSDGPEKSLYSSITKRLAPACHKMIDILRTQNDYQVLFDKALTQKIAKKTIDDCSLIAIALDN